MISDIYLLTFTMFNRYDEPLSFHDFIMEEFPDCITDHLPKGVNFESIEYRTDGVVSALLQHLVSEMTEKSLEEAVADLEVEVGYYHIQLEGEDDLSHQRREEIEFVISMLHDSYSFIASFIYYLGDAEVILFERIHTFESNEGDDFEHDNLNHYAPLIESYFYRGKIPDSYADELAKMMLIGSGI